MEFVITVIAHFFGNFGGERNMNILNIILLIMGIFNIIVGITWTKKNVINFVFKLLFLVGGGYLVFYALYLSNILIVLNR